MISLSMLEVDTFCQLHLIPHLKSGICVKVLSSTPFMDMKDPQIPEISLHVKTISVLQVMIQLSCVGRAIYKTPLLKRSKISRLKLKKRKIPTFLQFLLLQTFVQLLKHNTEWYQPLRKGLKLLFNQVIKKVRCHSEQTRK